MKGGENMKPTTKEKIIVITGAIIIFALFTVVVYIFSLFYTSKKEVKSQQIEIQKQQEKYDRYEAVKATCLEIVEGKTAEWLTGLEELALSNNPFLPDLEEKIPQMVEDYRNSKYKECMDIWAK